MLARLTDSFWTPFIFATVLSLITLGRLSRMKEDDSRKHQDFVDDIRAMNTYNSFFLSAIGIFLGVVFDKGHTVAPNALSHMLIAFAAAGVAIFFWPMPKPSDGAAQPGIKWRWKLVLFPSQWVIVFVTCGILGAVLPKIRASHAAAAAQTASPVPLRPSR